MSSARRFQLLSQARSVRFAKGEQLFPHTQAPQEVCMILTGTVCIFTEIPGEPEPVFMEELGPGDCAGWVSALAGSVGLRAVAKTEVQGLLVLAPAFLEIARYDPALREDMFSRVRKGEVWRAVLSEMERRTGGISSAREIVAGLFEDCVTRDWPEDEETVVTDRERIWIVAGGEGVKSGDRWGSADGVLWARLIGLPSDKLTKALAGDIPRPSKETLRARSASSSASSFLKGDAAATSSTAERAGLEKLPPEVPTLDGVGKPPRRSIWKALGTAFAIAAATSAGAAFWASQQPTTEPFTTAGSLSFVGERRTVTAGVAGKITEWGMRSGARIERGSIIAIIQPPMDEARVKALAEAVDRAHAQADYCEAALAGRIAKSQMLPKNLVELATELARLRSEHRVLAAVERGATTDYTLTATERQRVTAIFASARAEQMDALSSASRDASARRDELRDAEAELREAQAELSVEMKAFADIRAQKNNEESRQEQAAAQRALNLTKRTVTQKQEVVNRLHKEIAKMGVEAETAPAASDKATDSLPTIRADIAKIEEQLERNIDSLRREATASGAALAKLRAESAPRQIEALQPGLVLEAAPLAVGSVVQTDSILGRLTTRQGWEVECHMNPDDLARLRAGQDLSIVTVNADGTTTRLAERMTVASRPDERPRLKMLSSRDDWHDGTPVRIEASVVTGTLLDAWLAQIRLSMGL